MCWAELRRHCADRPLRKQGELWKSQKDEMTHGAGQQNESNLYTTEDEIGMHSRGQLRIYPVCNTAATRPHRH